MGENVKEDIWTSGFIMFQTSKAEVSELLVDLGSATIEPDFITINNYPFKPAIAYGQKTFQINDIVNVDLNASPPTIRVGKELVFISAKQKESLSLFANYNEIEIIERPNIWSWILEPFLDAEYSKQTDSSLTLQLAGVGLTKEFVTSLRQEVKEQMLKYNFDTCLWEWVSLDSLDVLKAMRTKYNDMEFADFYKRLMEIALIGGK